MLVLAAGCGLRCLPTAAIATDGTAQAGGTALTGWSAHWGLPAGPCEPLSTAHDGGAAQNRMSRNKTSNETNADIPVKVFE